MANKLSNPPSEDVSLENMARQHGRTPKEQLRAMLNAALEGSHHVQQLSTQPHPKRVSFVTHLLAMPLGGQGVEFERHAEPTPNERKLTSSKERMLRAVFQKRLRDHHNQKLQQVLKVRGKKDEKA
jgi:hypothetical protein